MLKSYHWRTITSAKAKTVTWNLTNEQFQNQREGKKSTAVMSPTSAPCPVARRVKFKSLLRSHLSPKQSGLYQFKSTLQMPSGALMSFFLQDTAPQDRPKPDTQASKCTFYLNARNVLAFPPGIPVGSPWVIWERGNRDRRSYRADAGEDGERGRAVFQHLLKQCRNFKQCLNTHVE